MLNVKTSQFGCFTVEYNLKDDEEEVRRKMNHMMGFSPTAPAATAIAESLPKPARVYRIFFKGSLYPSGGKTLGEIGVKSDDTLEIVSLLTVVVKAPCGQSWSFEIFDNDTIGALKREFAKVRNRENKWFGQWWENGYEWLSLESILSESTA